MAAHEQRGPLECGGVVPWGVVRGELSCRVVSARLLEDVPGVAKGIEDVLR